MSQQDDIFAFLAGGGGVETLMRRMDWSQTPLGPVIGWGQSLRTSISIVLRSPTPIVMMWGPDAILIYNDAYARFAGGRHPDILGLPARDAWPEIADHNQNMIDICLAGRALSLRDQLMMLNRNGVAEEVYLDLFYSPVPDDHGVPAGALVIVVETTDRVLAERRRIDEMQRMHRMFDQAPGFVAILGGPDHIFEFTNPAYRELIGGRDVIGQRLADAIPEVVAQGFVARMNAAFQSGEPHVGIGTAVSLRRDGSGGEETRSLDFIYQPIRDEGDQITHILVMGMDVTERVRAQEHQRFLLNELNHRVKNSLATVQSVVRHTLRQSSSLKEASESISARILALSRAQDVLTGQSWAETTVETVLRSAVEPMGAQRFHLNGPEVALGRRQALALSLAVHELATNAVKYGALANDDGTVRISWGVEGNNAPRFRLTWLERGGPPVCPPTRRGFGMDVIERGLGAELDADVAMSYAPEGFALELDARLDAVKIG
ncbi:sensor histidine kinase [Falsirhodobacter xinxiangensis]|uniref:sensor histidine kinase n=1 Tax=Falsirhodobacter xinxiangensis TaxID=2530049 RepID=UPI0010AAC5EA|nr:HWE histidine kinase domain-containing protein [Rhodobacter xinxiangensis]